MLAKLSEQMRNAIRQFTITFRDVITDEIHIVSAKDGDMISQLDGYRGHIQIRFVRSYR